MKNKYILVLMLVVAVAVCFFMVWAKPQKNTAVYTFSGASDAIAINNGLIIVTDDMDKFVGGDLTFKEGEMANIKESAVRFYFFKDGVETTIQENRDSIVGSAVGTKIQKDTGSSSAKDLFYGDDLDLIVKSLHFQLRGTFISGEKFEYDCGLDVKQVLG